MKPARMLPVVTFGVAISFFFVPPVLALIGANPTPVRAPAAKLRVERIEPVEVLQAVPASVAREMGKVSAGMAKAIDPCGPADATPSRPAPARQALRTIVAALPPTSPDP